MIPPLWCRGIRTADPGTGPTFPPFLFCLLMQSKLPPSLPSEPTGWFVCPSELYIVCSGNSGTHAHLVAPNAEAWRPLLWRVMPLSSGSSGKNSCSSSSGSKWRNSSEFSYLLHPLKRRIRVREKAGKRGPREVYSVPQGRLVVWVPWSSASTVWLGPNQSSSYTQKSQKKLRVKSCRVFSPFLKTLIFWAWEGDGEWALTKSWTRNFLVQRVFCSNYFDCLCITKLFWADFEYKEDLHLKVVGASGNYLSMNLFISEFRFSRSSI